MAARSSLMRSAALTAPCGSSAISAIAREDVVGKRQERVAFRAGRKRVQRLLGAIGKLFGPAEGVVDRRVLLQAAQQLRPLIGRNGSRRDDLADDARRNAVVRLPE